VSSSNASVFAGASTSRKMAGRRLDGMFHRRASGALAVVLCLSCIGPAGAMALEPGVHVDPNSPSAKEYGVPLWVLRGQGAGQQSPEGIPPPPLFGVGIGPPSRGAGGTSAGSRTGGGSGGGSGSSGGSSKQRSGGGSSARGGSTSGGGSGALTPAAIAQLTREGSTAPHVGLVVGGVLVGGLLIGGAVAFGMRRLTR
jgi:hypothetical protein